MLMVSVCWGWWAEGSVSGGWFQVPQPGKRSEAWLAASCRFPRVGHGGEYTCLPLVSNILDDMVTHFPWQGLGLSIVLLITRHPKHYICFLDHILFYIYIIKLERYNYKIIYLYIFFICFISLPPLSSSTSSHCNAVILPHLCCGKILFLLFTKGKLRSFHHLTLSWEWKEMNTCLISQNPSGLCSGRGPYHCNVSCHYLLVRKAWVLTILVRFKYQAPEMKQRPLQSIPSKSGWISLYNVMPSYSTILSCEGAGVGSQRLKYHEGQWEGIFLPCLRQVK